MCLVFRKKGCNFALPNDKRRYRKEKKSEGRKVELGAFTVNVLAVYDTDLFQKVGMDFKSSLRYW